MGRKDQYSTSRPRAFSSSWLGGGKKACDDLPVVGGGGKKICDDLPDFRADISYSVLGDESTELSWSSSWRAVRMRSVTAW